MLPPTRAGFRLNSLKIHEKMRFAPHPHSHSMVPGGLLVTS
jgi:hypothetical protein